MREKLTVFICGTCRLYVCVRACVYVRARVRCELINIGVVCVCVCVCLWSKTVKRICGLQTKQKP